MSSNSSKAAAASATSSTQQRQQYVDRITIMILGGSQVGKTSLARAVNDVFSDGSVESSSAHRFGPTVEMTIGQQFMETGVFQFEGHAIQLRFIESVGGLLARRLFYSFVPRTDVILLLHDASRTTSLSDLSQFYRELTTQHASEEVAKCYRVVIGNKLDVRPNAATKSHDLGAAVANANGIDCAGVVSAETLENVKSVFEDIIRQTFLQREDNADANAYLLMEIAEQAREERRAAKKAQRKQQRFFPSMKEMFNK